MSRAYTPCPTRRSSDLMVRPAVGFLAVRERFRRAHLPERVFFANSDLSGLSLFEEDTRSGRCARRNRDRKSTRLNSSHRCISYAVFCLKKKTDRKEDLD